MTRERIGQVVFLGAAALAAILYALTVPQGVPWNESTHWAVGYLGGGAAGVRTLPAGLPHPIWGRFVQVFGGNVALSCACAALGAGLLAALVNRYFGWRAAVSAAIVWIWMPWVWNCAITGERGVVLAAMTVAAAWTLNAAGLWVTRKVRAMMMAASGGQGLTALPNGVTIHEVHEKRARINRIAGWVAMGAAGIFAVVSMSFHDYRLGEAASVFARGVVEEAGERIIVANGLVDEQIGREVKSKSEEVKSEGAEKVGRESRWTKDVILLRNDEGYRKGFVEWVRREWPNETNLWVAAEVSPTAFVQVAERRWSERFYLMNGASTTAEGWEKRWNDFAPYLTSSDRFVAVAKIAFAHEGEAVAKRLEAAGDRKRAKRIREKIKSKSEKGKSGGDKVKVKGAIERSEIAERSVGLREQRIVNFDNFALIEWSNEMTAAMERGERFAAGRIARAILSNPAWAGYIPANAIMGTIASSEGDYTASAAFFAVAVSTTNAVPPVVLNDYADTLMRLGRMEEAEQMARRAVRESGEDFWLARLTLAEVLRARYCRMERVEVVENGERVERYQKAAGAEQAEAEIAELVKTICRHAPKSACEKIRKEYGKTR